MANGTSRLYPDPESNGTAWLQSYVARTGSTSVPNALSDQDDATYVRRSSGTSGKDMVAVQVQDPFLIAGMRVVSVVPGMRYKLAATDGKGISLALQQIKDKNAKTVYTGIRRSFGKATVATNVDGVPSSGQLLAPDGTPWTEASVDALIVAVADSHTSTDANRAYVYELYAQLYWLFAATVNVTGPATPVTDTSWPTITVDVSAVVNSWQINVAGVGEWLTGGNVQIRVFTDTQYGAPGFDPETSPCVWETVAPYVNNTYIDGTAAATVTVSATPDVPMPNGSNLRIYARASRDVPAGPTFWGDWAYRAISMSLNTCDAPTCNSVATSTGHHWNVASFTVASKAGHTSPVLQVQAQYDNGAPWLDVRGYSSRPISFDVATPAYDTEAPGSNDLKVHTAFYRARVETTYSGQRVTSDWSTPEAIDAPYFGYWTVRPYQGPGVMLPDSGLIRVLGDHTETRSEDVALFAPKGRALPVVVSGDLHGRDGELRIAANRGAVFGTDEGQINHPGDFPEANELALVDMLANLQVPMLLESPWDDYRWIRIIDRSYTRTGGASAERRVYTLRYVEVDRPAV